MFVRTDLTDDLMELKASDAFLSFLFALVIISWQSTNDPLFH